MVERILIVDDDPVQRRLLQSMLARAGYDVVIAEGGDAAAALLTGADAAEIDAVVLDLVMPDLDGLGVLARIREAGLTTPVIVQTAHGGIDNVVSAMRAGATDFVVKPVGAERLEVSLRNALATKALASEIQRIKRSHSGTLTFKDIITRSQRMHAVLRQAEKAAGSAIPVLIEGRSGVGKELIARAIHGSGERRARPFVAVNCGAIPDNLVESLLFGHEKGAFTGATDRHTGKFVEAHGGTLFLDEVGELPPAAQVKLLRAIQEGEVEPVGARKPVKVDVRLISATNRDLIADVKDGRFREDLFYRLHVYPIAVPSLAERPEDIPELARHFLARFAAEEGKRIRRIDNDAHDPAVRLPLARQRPAARECGVPRCGARGRQTRSASPTSRRSPRWRSANPWWPHRIIADGRLAGDGAAANGSSCLPTPLQEIAAPVGSIAPYQQPEAGLTLPLLDAQGEVRALEELEAEVIRFAIAHYRGQMSEVARRLQIGRSTLYRKLDALGLQHRMAENDTDPVVTG